MTPNKLPPLPELEEVLDLIGKATQGPWAFIREKDTDSLLAFGTDSLDIDRRPPWYSSWSAIEPNDGRALIAAVNFLRNHGESVAEALRQSQSLPAGAVAGLLSDWREREHRFHGMGGQYVAEKLADELEQALQADAREKGEAVYVEARQCDGCGHVGINDAHGTDAACHDCEWSGQSPQEDQCPGCGHTGCMTAACPRCGCRYALLADATIPLATQPAQASEPDHDCSNPESPCFHPSHDEDDSKPVGAEAVAEQSIESLRKAIASCNGHLINDRANDKAAWDAVSFIQSHGSECLAALQADAREKGEADTAEASAALRAVYDDFCAKDNGDVPLENYPHGAVNALARAGWAVVPCALPFAILGESARAGLLETGNPKHLWDYLIAKTRIYPNTALATQPAQASEKDNG